MVSGAEVGRTDEWELFLDRVWGLFKDPCGAACCQYSSGRSINKIMLPLLERNRGELRISQEFHSDIFGHNFTPAPPDKASPDNTPNG